MSFLVEPEELCEITIRVYEKGTLPDGRTLLDFQHDAIAFKDERLTHPSFIRQALMAVASSLPPDPKQNITNPVELFPTSPEELVPA